MLLVASCWFLFSSPYVHDARSHEPKIRRTVFCTAAAGYRPVTCIRICDTDWRANYTIKNVEKWPGLWTCTTNGQPACRVTLIYVFICWSFWIHCLLVSRTNVFYFVWLLDLVDVVLVSVEVAFCALSFEARVTVWCFRAADHIVWPFVPVSVKMSDV
jgi:hypothetical protein